MQPETIKETDPPPRPSTCTKCGFFSLTALVVVLFLLSSLALTIRLIIGEFLCHKPSINGLAGKSK